MVTPQGVGIGRDPKVWVPEVDIVEGGELVFTMSRRWNLRNRQREL
jgi:hypothetical protein